MKISVVIVNYNVKYFIEQCLHSVLKSAKNINTEIFVVDNNSVDGSCSMIREKFPQVILIENKNNPGFSVANNQAILKAKGEYILVLNPDTVLEENTLTKCLQFMDNNPETGALGVKMIDGKGNFLPESKRSLPKPSVAFCKIFGLSRLFPKSKIFNKYHLGYLNENDINEIEVLPGAFMFIRKKTLEKTGLFDERFFMYGEDIDLSFRIQKAGYKIFYFPETTIIHYKGESTKKGSINYVLVFYNAMIIFARKHFSKKNARLYATIINLAVYARAGISIIKRIFKSSVYPVLSIIVIYMGFYFFLPFWEKEIFNTYQYYPKHYLGLIVPTYILIWMVSVFISGGFDKYVKVFDHIKSIAYGTIFLLIIYALLPQNLRFSRALIIFGTLWAILSTLIIRYFLSFLTSDFSIGLFKKRKKILIIGEIAESNRVYSLLEQSVIKPELVGLVHPNENVNSDKYLGNIHQIADIVHIHKADELIFCAKDISSQDIIRTMLTLANSEIDFKIAPPESLSIIGSNSIDTAGDLYFIDINSVVQPKNLRKKRLLDVSLSLFFLILSPLLIFFVKKPLIFIKNINQIVIGKFSFVGFYYENNKQSEDLPRIKQGILTPGDAISKNYTNTNEDSSMNIYYARDYKIVNDLRIILKGFKKMDRKTKIIHHGKI